MTTKASSPTRKTKLLARPVEERRRLLPEHCPDTHAVVADKQDHPELALHATIADLTLQYELDHMGYHHGGLNE